MRTLQNQLGWCSRAQIGLVAVTLTLVTAFYFGSYRPQSQRQAQLAKQIADQKKSLATGKAQTSVLDSVVEEVRALRAKLERSQKSIPQQQDLPAFIRDVTQLSQQASLKKFIMKPDIPSRIDLVSELPIRLTFEGDFISIYSFLRNTEQMPRLTRVRDMRLSSRDKNGQVKVELTMNIYFSPDE
jgi:Tfp pilus assembly protein PilO